MDSSPATYAFYVVKKSYYSACNCATSYDIMYCVKCVYFAVSDFIPYILEVNTFPENREKLKKILDSLKPILVQLKPILELR